MSNIKIELLDPSANTINRYDDEVSKHGGLIGCVLYHGKRKVRGIYSISYRHIYGDPLFIIDPSERDLLRAIEFDTINCNCNINDLKTKTGLTISQEIIKVKKSKIYSEEYKRDVIVYSSEEIDNAFLANYIPPKKSPAQFIQEWCSAPIWVRALTLIVPFSLLSIELDKFLTTQTLIILLIIVVSVFSTPYFVDYLMFFLEGLVGRDWGKISFWIIALNLGSLILPLFGTKKVKGSQF